MGCFGNRASKISTKFRQKLSTSRWFRYYGTKCASSALLLYYLTEFFNYSNTHSSTLSFKKFDSTDTVNLRNPDAFDQVYFSFDRDLNRHKHITSIVTSVAKKIVLENISPPKNLYYVSQINTQLWMVFAYSKSWVSLSSLHPRFYPKERYKSHRCSSSYFRTSLLPHR